MRIHSFPLLKFNKRGEEMKKIITVTGKKGSNKYEIAMNFSKNENVSFISPVTDDKRVNRIDFHYMSRDKLSDKINDEPPLQTTVIRGWRYCHFASQLDNDFNVLIVDDFAVQEVKENWAGKIVTVYVEGGVATERTGMALSSEWFDYIVYDGMDLDYLIEQIAADMMEI